MNVNDFIMLNRQYVAPTEQQVIDRALTSGNRPGVFDANVEDLRTNREARIRLFESINPTRALTWAKILQDTKVQPSIDRRKDLVSFSGSDFDIVIWFPLDGQSGAYAVNTLQTVTVSTFRDLIPGRVLGRASVNGYARGTRSVAGTISMVLAQEDSFTKYLPAMQASNKLAGSNERPFYLDRIPPFWMILTASSETIVNETTGGPTTVNAGAIVIENIHLFETGMTLSVNDIYTETMYQYVAEDIQPFASNNIKEILKSFQMDASLRRPPEKTVSDMCLEARDKETSTEAILQAFGAASFADPGLIATETVPLA